MYIYKWCCIVSLFLFHKICAHRPELLDQTFLLCLFHSLIFSHNFSVILFWFFCSVFPHIFCLVCLFSIFFQIFIVILHNPICFHIYCPSHTVWSHVPKWFFCAVARFVLSCLCAFPFFQLCLEVSELGLLCKSLQMKLCVLHFFTFLAFLLCPGELLWFLSNSGCGSVSDISWITSQNWLFGKGTRIKTVGRVFVAIP